LPSTTEQRGWLIPPVARCVAAAAEELKAIVTVPPVIGLLGGIHLYWIVELLAGRLAGKASVPLWAFFRAEQPRQIQK